MRRSSAPKTRRSVPESSIEPASEIRPIAPASPDGAPSPRESIRMGELADQYCRLRAEAARLNDRLTPVGVELCALMKKLGRAGITTADGLVSFRAGTADGEMVDADKMVEILKGLKIEIPMKKRAGMSDRLEFKKNG